MPNPEVYQIEISANNAHLSQMIAAVIVQTGDNNPFFCPQVVEGQLYQGHVHVMPPAGAIDIDLSPIHLE